jgi:3-phenylpropionate/trans-cinnamate dioxygenase ferredoxin reductase subunit
MDYDYAVIGGGVSGYFAVKELAGKGRVILISEEPDMPYDKPPLSKGFLRGEKNAPFFEKPEFYNSNGIIVLLNEAAEKIENHTIITSSGLRIGFKKALIATGGKPRKIGLPSESKRGVYYLRTLRDDLIIKNSGAKRFAIIGGGFIGVEVAASLRQIKKEVTVVEAAPRILSKLGDESFSSYVEEYIKSKGVEAITGTSVESIEGSKQVEAIKLKNGNELKAEAVLIAVGIKPSVELALNSGIRANDGIEVDEHMMTSLEDVYASGDVALLYNSYLGEKLRIEHWNNAQYTGMLAARNMLGNTETYDFFSTVWSDVFDIHIESAGITSGWEERATVGSVQANKFANIYIKEKMAVGYTAVNLEWEKIKVLNETVKGRKQVTNPVNFSI